jgi:catechol 2,3-dioxygenase-like lactoylglutathione lyase family enzyme
MTVDAMKLQLAMLFAKDMERMTAFYRDGLGLAVVPERSEEGWVVFDADGTLFALHAIPAVIASGIQIPDPPDERSQTPLKLVFETADFEGVCSRLQARGAKLREPRSSGSRDVIDPEGNVLSLTRA